MIATATRSTRPVDKPNGTTRLGRVRFVPPISLSLSLSLSLTRCTARDHSPPRCTQAGSGFILGTDALYFGSQDNHFYSLNAATGSKNWRFPTGSPVSTLLAGTASALKAIALLRRLAAALLLTQTEVPSSLDVMIRRFMPSTPQLASKSGSIQQADRYICGVLYFQTYRSSHLHAGQKRHSAESG